MKNEAYIIIGGLILLIILREFSGIGPGVSSTEGFDDKPWYMTNEFLVPLIITVFVIAPVIIEAYKKMFIES